MSTFEDERLRILARVSAGELTPQEGQLQIAMLKVRTEGLAATAPAEPERPRAPAGAPRPPSRLALLALLLTPILVVGTLGVALFGALLAIPAFLVTLAWNGVVVPAVPGTAVVGFWPVLATMVLVGFLSSGLRWRRRVRVFMSRPGEIREQ